MKENIKIISKADFIKALASNSNYTQGTVADILNFLDETLSGFLCEATEELPVQVNVSKGLCIGAKFGGKRDINVPGYGIVRTEDKIRPYAKFFKGLRRRLGE